MNNVTLIGRLTADPELKHTASGIATTRFTIAVDRTFVKQGEERQTDFISLVAWRQTAEFICKYFSKGRRIAIVGEIRTGSYTDKDGNKRYTTDVVVNNAEFCDSKRDSGDSGDGYSRSYQNSYQQNSRPEQVAAPSYSNGDVGDFMETPGDEDLPF